MKPTIAPKKKPAKRKVVSQEDFAKRNPILSKLLDLKCRINEKQTSERKHIDRQWVETLIDNVRAGGTVGKGRMLRANDMWRKYE